MKFSCDSCHAQYVIADDKVGDDGLELACKKCGHLIDVMLASARDTGAAASEPAADAGAEADDTDESAPVPALVPASASAPWADAGSASVAAARESLGAGFDDVDGALDALLGELELTSGAPGAARGQGSGDDVPAGRSARDFAASDGTPSEHRDALPPSASDDVRWYVAVDDAQVGPVALAEIEKRWDAQEITASSLCWSAGMPDWAPIADVSELAYMLTERPQAAALDSLSGGASVVAKQAGAGDKRAAAAVLRPMVFGGDVGGADVAWKPSAASALSSLVADELSEAERQEAEQQQRASQRPAGVPDVGVPGFGAADLFGSASESAPGALGARAVGAAVTPASWGPGVGTRRRPSGIRSWQWLVGVVGAGAMGAVGAVWLLSPKQRSVAGTASAASAASVASAASARGATSPRQATDDAGISQTPAPQHQAPAVTGLESTPTADSRAAARDREPEAAQLRREPAPRQRRMARPLSPSATKHRATHATSAPERVSDREAERVSDREAERVSDRERERVSEREREPEPARPALSKADIVAVVKENAATVAPCLKAAKARGEIVDGTYKFVLDWTIRPDGSVAQPRLTGPSNVLATSLPRCFEKVIADWRFPASSDGAPVTNFPFGPVTVR